MTLDEALGQPGRLVAAWDHRWPSRAVLEVYVTGDAGARRIHREEVPPEQREATVDRVLGRGVRLGGCCSYSGHVWVLDGDGVGVWTAERSLVEGRDGVIALRSGAVQARDIQKVTTFVDAKDWSYRGIRCQLATGRGVVFVDERREAGATDAMSDDAGLREDMRWATLLGQDLAMWLGVPHVDQDGDTTNGRHLEVRARSLALADGIETLPETGAFEHVTQVIGAFAPYGQLQYRYAPNPLDPTRRFLELRLHTPSGKGAWARWVKQGSSEQVTAFLRDVRTPHAILVHMGAMARKLEQERYA